MSQSQPDSEVRGACVAGFGYVILAVIAALMLTRSPASAQEVTTPALKAAFIYNFTKFIEWPAAALSPEQPLVMCVLGDEEVRDALARVAKARLLAGRILNVLLLVDGAPHQVCHVLYVSGLPAAQMARQIAAVRNLPVLTISDVDGFMEMGGIAQFFLARGQLRFDIHEGAARLARLQVSAKLLALAKQK